MRAKPLIEAPDPVAESLAAIPLWPDAALFALARAVAVELCRRDLPTPAALPVLDLACRATAGVDLLAGVVSASGR